MSWNNIKYITAFRKNIKYKTGFRKNIKYKTDWRKKIVNTKWTEETKIVNIKNNTAWDFDIHNPELEKKHVRCQSHIFFYLLELLLGLLIIYFMYEIKICSKHKR